MSDIDRAMAGVAYDKLDDGTFARRGPRGGGVVAFDPTLTGCQRPLRSTFEDWLVLGMKLGHDIPVLAGVDLNAEPVREPPDAVQPPCLRRLRALGFDGPWSGSRHQFMVLDGRLDGGAGPTVLCLSSPRPRAGD